ncbi:DUF7507 domain-containing protein, partial [Flavobacterium sp. RSSA_27]|uniref:DUF7507 domain-containing protein n=1 Tax=Flavobacterium sp. RSSA_27 TaxID=3447667 RepID=UPI003F3B3249
TGNVTLTNVTVTDNNAVVTGGPIATLAVGATDSTTFSASHTITQDDINKGFVYNLALATAKDPNDKPVTDTSSDPTPCTTCPKEPECTYCTITELNQSPGLVVIKTSTTPSFSIVGDVINYTIIVKNTGNVTLNTITVKDPLTGLNTLIEILQPGQTAEYNQNYTVTQENLNTGFVTNTAIADGFTPDNKPINATDEEIVNEKPYVIDAVDDTINAGNGAIGNNNAGNVLTSNPTTPDTLNGAPTTPATVIISIVTPATPLNSNSPVPSLDISTGTISVPENTPAGSYTIEYTICDKQNITNCDTAIATVIVSPSEIIAQNDDFVVDNTIERIIAGSISKDNGNGEDTLNGVKIEFDKVIVTVTEIILPSGEDYPVPNVDINSKDIIIPKDVPAGVYTIFYTICEKLNPSNCDSAIITITVTAPKVIAEDDYFEVVNIEGGNPNIGNVLNANPNTFDSVRSKPAEIDRVNIKVVTPATPIETGAPTPIINTITGIVSVPDNTPAGTYTIEYSLCEKINPTNCDLAIVTVVVIKPSMTVTGEAVCINDVPYFKYTTTANNFTPVNGLTITWKDTNNNVVSTMSNLPLNGQVLWPGAVVDANGNGTDWPGWLLVNGKWIEGADGFENLRPTATVSFTLNPTETITVSYPPSSPFCTSRPAFTIDAVDDVSKAVNGLNSNINVLNVFNNDTLNTDPVNPKDVDLTIITPDATGTLTLNPDGSIDVKEGTPAGTYTLVYQICEKADFGNCDTATVTVPVICEDNTKVFGKITNVDTNTPLANVPVTLKPLNGTPGPILFRVTKADGSYSFDNMVPGDYVLQVQDANLNSAFGLFNINPSFLIIKVEKCNYLRRDFDYGKTDLPVLGDFVWYDLNNNGKQDEWYDANNDGIVTKNIPDSNGAIDFSKWEWIDFNGDNSYEGVLNTGELNAAGYGNGSTNVPNIFITGPNNFNRSVTMGILGFWRSRPPLGAYGEYRIEFKKDPLFEAASEAIAATGLVKVLPSASNKNGTSKTSKTNSYIDCGSTTNNILFATLTEQDRVNLNIDFGISCKTFAGLDAVDDTYSFVQCSQTGVIGNVITANDLLNGTLTTTNDVNFKIVTGSNPFITFDAIGNVTILSGISAGKYVFTYQICNNLFPTDCDTATITIDVTPIAPIEINSVACNADSTLIDLNTLLPTDIPTGGRWIDSSSTNRLNGSEFNPFELSIGDYQFEYRIETGDCPRSVFVNMNVNFDCKVLGCGTILVHNAFSPNGDGLNDFFKIDNIDDTICYPENTIEIYNRWGILVFDTKNYNNSANYFDGVSRGRTTISQSSGLPTGTYFYILTYTSFDLNGNEVHNKKDGYLYISR